MELTLSDAKDLDKVLLFLNGQKDNAFFTIQDIANDVFDVTKENHVRWLVKQLTDYKHEIIKELTVKYVGTGNFSKGNYTNRILDEGGFEAIYNNALEQHKKQEERVNRQDQIMNLTIEDLVDKIISQPKMKTRERITTIAAAVSALGAILTWILSLRQC
jgi:hypothetical protein